MRKQAICRSSVQLTSGHLNKKKVVFDVLNGIGYGKKENEDKAKTNISNQNKNSESEVLNVSE